MTTANPFAGKFKVEVDQEDFQEVTSSNTKPTEQYFSQKEQAPKKKKKVRPENKPNEPAQKGPDDEGFEVVSKHKTTNKKKPETLNANDDEQVHKEHRPRREGKRGERGGPFRGIRGKREYERHSGTGRGREIAKGGAGGKYTWGGKSEEPYEENNDDYVFEEALNPKSEIKEEPKNEDAQEKAEQAEPEQQGEQEENKEDYKEDRRRKERKAPEPKEIPEEEKLNVPENAISVADFLKMNKTEEKEVKVERPKESQNLQFKVKEENYELGTTGAGKKGGKKKKEKKNNKGVEMIQEFGGYDEGNRRNWNQGGYQKKQKFRFNEEDFPAMK